MNNKKNSIVYILLGIVLCIAFILLFVNFKQTGGYLHFSDGAKFANIAENIINNKDYKSDFNFYLNTTFEDGNFQANTAKWINPVTPILIAGLFRIVGINDLAVMVTSSVFYLLTLITLFFTSKKIFGNLVAFLTTFAVMVNVNILNYAISGASEIILIFEISFATYLFIQKKKITDIVGILLLILMYFTRPQAFIYITGFVLLWLLLHYPVKKAIKYFFGVIIFGVIIDVLVLPSLSGIFFIYPIIGRGASTVSQVSLNGSPSDMLRGGVLLASFSDIVKKFIYNLYNFYKLLPQIISPYLVAFFALSIFIKEKDKDAQMVKLTTIYMTLLTFIVTALTIPFYRYIHPVLPLVYLFSISTLVQIARYIKINKINIKIRYFVPITTTLLIMLFTVGQSLGTIFLDSRFERKDKNIGKPPLYVQLSRNLTEITKSNDLILTNLDTWGSWYGKRRTIWYPIDPEILAHQKNNPFTYIYLTNYLIDDKDYYMGPEWRQVFSNPEEINNEYLRANYKVAKIITIPASETYENQEGKAVLLVRKAE